MAFTNDVDEVQNALVTLCGAFTDPNGGSVTASKAMSSNGITDAQLPYIWVKRGRQLNRDEVSTDLYSDARQYQVLIYVSSLSNGEYDDESEFDNAVNWIKPFHKYLADNRQFSDVQAHIDLVNVRDTGDVNLFSKDGVRYAGIAFTIPIKTYTRF